MSEKPDFGPAEPIPADPSRVDANQTAGAAATGNESLQPDAQRKLPPAAQRALAEAAERRRLRELAHEPRPKEINGRDGPEPARYGDWEVKGIASDF